MKLTTFLIIVIFLFAVGCGKKSEPVNCYVCNTYDSVTSNIPALTNAHYKKDTANYCQLTQAQANFIILQNTKTDTLYNHGDTIVLEHWSEHCDLTY